jgi:glutathione synthase/RimK-type ligase-like ATP-grasp enzyme
MAQRYIPDIVKGDKRILVIGGKPVPFALARIPQNGEVRGNLAAGGVGVAQPHRHATSRSPRRWGRYWPRAACCW